MTSPAHPQTLKQTIFRIPLLWIASAFAAGVATGDAMPVFPVDIALLAAMAIAAPTVVILFTRNQRAIILVALISFVLGVSAINFYRMPGETTRIAHLYDTGVIVSGEPAELAGRVAGGIEPAVDGVFITVEAVRIVNRKREFATSGAVRLFLPLSSNEAIGDLERAALGPGVGVTVSCEIQREDAFLVPGVTPRREILERQGLDATGTVKSPLLIEVTDRPAFSLMGPFYRVRDELIETFRSSYSREVGGILIATILGDKYFLDRGTADAFRAGGTFHILVISGLHMTFIGAVILLFVRRFTRDRWVQLAATAAFVWTYTLAVGGEPPAVRASLMITLVLLGRALFRSVSLLNIVVGSGLILLLARPTSLFDPSFQLTMLSAMSIVGIALPLIGKLHAIGNWTPSAAQPFPPVSPDFLKGACETLYWNDRVWEIESKRNTWSGVLKKSPYFELGRVRTTLAWLVDGVLVSVIVQVAMLPLLVYYFHRLPLGAFLMNVWVGSVMAVMSLSAIAAAIVQYVSAFLAWPLIQLTETLGSLLLALMNVMTGEHSRRIPIYAEDGWWLYAGYFVPLVLAAVLIYSWDPFARKAPKAPRIRLGAAALAIAGLTGLGGTILFHPYSAPAADGMLTVEFLDVGQGDATFIRFPNGETMLIDGGGRVAYGDEDEQFERDGARIGEFVVSEFLWEKGYSSIDHIAASHADADHIQGLVDVASNFRIGQALFASVQGESRDYQELDRVLTSRGTPRRLLSAGDSIAIGEATVTVLYPGSGEVDLTENDRSLVLVLQYKDVSILFTGDIEREAETRLLAAGKLEAFDIVKVPHHGSRTSSSAEFVDVVRPQIAVIPVGRRSHFGHPHKEVTDRWQASGATVVTTGECGTVTLRSDGLTMSTERYACK